MTRIEIVVEDEGWRKARGLSARLKEAATLALRRGAPARGGAQTTKPRGGAPTIKQRGGAPTIKPRGGAPATGIRKGALTILLSGDKQVRTLNADFRGKRKPTNVLSFPAAANEEGYLGDIALAFGVTDTEARRSRKRFAHHATHLVVHGVLHLLGYDHETAREAAVMEPLETKILAELGIADPYAARGEAA